MTSKPWRKTIADPSPADWGLNMSLCIALLCERDKAIVVVSDQKVDFGGYSADTVVMKSMPFVDRWQLMFAGDDMEHADPIIERSKEIIAASPKKPKPSAIVSAVDEAYAERIHSQITRNVLRKRGFDVDSFREKGKQKCTPSAYLSLCSRIDQVSISLKFLLCGFDARGDGHIFCIDGENSPMEYTPVGMWAIGSGAYSAMGWLSFFADSTLLNRYQPRQRVAYFGLTAKFMAETSGLGKNTFAHVIEPSDKPNEMIKLNPIPWYHVKKVREMWENEGIPRVPRDLDERMKEHVLTWEQYQVEISKRLAPQSDSQKSSGQR